ncbi:nucleotidyltransferase family protein [Roseicyclus mahoneyensis]|uniref:MurNAc alpha-1-phosphate uridylyltransferase n=1 Tax=Roseicyclus mahoneyensis TaxID=164332 RepID=A0A316GLC8_9RHOB|nr:nucleotidyltransferase family protein [Roseicyclus mahoneyensis]PWK61396.1 MurNAc alpha-1-phosphate uridylyltransferase [Roseicyclus mahoneyensis]
MIRPDVMILAAGFGTRMGALTADRPKPLIEVAGRPLLDHALEAARDGGGRITVNAHYRADQIAAHLAQYADIHLSVETPALLDSGGGVKRALPQLRTTPIATLNADAVWAGPGPLRSLTGAWDAARMSVLMLLVPRGRAIGRLGGGDVAMDAAGRLTWDRSEAGLVHTGAQLIDPALVADHPATVFSLLDIWQEQMDRGRVFGVIYPGRWADVGHPDGIAQAEAMLADA